MPFFPTSPLPSAPFLSPPSPCLLIHRAAGASKAGKDFR